MAKMIHLSNELIFLIASNIRKPSHILQFALTCKTVHSTAIKRLYDNIIFDRKDYPAFTIPKAFDFDTDESQEIMRINYDAPSINALCLAHMIKSKAIPKDQTISHLTIEVSINNELNRCQTLLSLLLPQLSSLKHLTLTTVWEDVGVRRHLREMFSFAPLGAALSAASHTLKTLDMSFYMEPEESVDWTIGSLRHFSQLEYLSIQDKVLLGQDDHESDGARIPSLGSVLPQGLKRLQLQWNTFGGGAILDTLMKDFINDCVKGPRKTHEVIVQLTAKADSKFKQDAAMVFACQILLLRVNDRRRGSKLTIVPKWREDLEWAERKGQFGTFVRSIQQKKLTSNGWWNHKPDRMRVYL